MGMLLGKTVLTIASFMPTYWYVKSNNAIVSIVNFKSENRMPIFTNMLIVLGFDVALLILASIVIRQKRTNA